MIKIILLLSNILLTSSCANFYSPIKPNIEKKIKVEPTSIKMKEPTNAIGKYDIDLNQELTYDKEVSQVNELNKISTETNTKTSQQQLMDALFANKNRSPKNIRTSYLVIVRQKKRVLRKKLSNKRRQFFKDQKIKRKKYSDEAKVKKDKFRKESHSKAEKKLFYSELDLQRKHFFATERDEKKVFDSNLKALEKEIDARFKDLDKEFDDNLKVYKSTYNK